jgi:hypothetical protein
MLIDAVRRTSKAAEWKIPSGDRDAKARSIAMG